MTNVTWHFQKMTNAMWHFQKILNKSYLLPIFSRFFIRTHGKIVLCHVATLMIFETFKIKIGKEVQNR
jgi:hypothetical protein